MQSSSTPTVHRRCAMANLDQQGMSMIILSNSACHVQDKLWQGVWWPYGLTCGCYLDTWSQLTIHMSITVPVNWMGWKHDGVFSVPRLTNMSGDADIDDELEHVEWITQWVINGWARLPGCMLICRLGCSCMCVYVTCDEMCLFCYDTSGCWII